MLDKSIEAHIEKKRTEAISLQHATANIYKGVWNSEVIIEVWNSVYKLFITNFMCSGMWWQSSTDWMRL